jgi:hypothetical protein
MNCGVGFNPCRLPNNPKLPNAQTKTARLQPGGSIRFAYRLTKELRIMRIRFPRTPSNSFDLFAWADAQRETRLDLPPAYRRVAFRGRISELHAIAFCQANAIGGVQQ